MIKSRDKNVTDFNVVDSVRHDIKVLVTKTRYTVLSASVLNDYTQMGMILVTTFVMKIIFGNAMTLLTKQN